MESLLLVPTDLSAHQLLMSYNSLVLVGEIVCNVGHVKVRACMVEVTGQCNFENPGWGTELGEGSEADFDDEEGAGVDASLVDKKGSGGNVGPLGEYGCTVWMVKSLKYQRMSLISNEWLKTYIVGRSQSRASRATKSRVFRSLRDVRNAINAADAPAVYGVAHNNVTTLSTQGAPLR